MINNAGVSLNTPPIGGRRELQRSFKERTFNDHSIYNNNTGYIAIALGILSYWQWIRKPFGIGNATAIGAATGRASAEADEEELTEIRLQVRFCSEARRLKGTRRMMRKKTLLIVNIENCDELTLGFPLEN